MSSIDENKLYKLNTSLYPNGKLKEDLYISLEETVPGGAISPTMLAPFLFSVKYAHSNVYHVDIKDINPLFNGEDWPSISNWGMLQDWSDNGTVEGFSLYEPELQLLEKCIELAMPDE